MMEHEMADDAILRTIVHQFDNINHEYGDRHGFDIFQTQWQTYRFKQLLSWFADNVDRIRRQAQGGTIEERVPDRLPRDSVLWTQPDIGACNCGAGSPMHPAGQHVLGCPQREPHRCNQVCQEDPGSCEAYLRMIGAPGYGSP